MQKCLKQMQKINILINIEEKAMDMIYSLFLTFHDLLFGNSFWKKLNYLSYKNYKSELKL